VLELDAVRPVDDVEPAAVRRVDRVKRARDVAVARGRQQAAVQRGKLAGVDGAVAFFLVLVLG
jgi:hypothetical protein